MITVSSLHELHKQTGNRTVALACGVFDGVHRGHQKLLEALRHLARRYDALPAALTFEPHPRMVLGSDFGPPRLTAYSQKVELLAHYGAEAAVVLDFNRQLAALSAEEFLQQYLLSSDLILCGIAVGCNWRFGAGGHGDLHFLQKAGKQHNFEVIGVQEQELTGMPISSTRIRRAIMGGDLESAQLMLGRPYAIRGRVLRGKGIARKKLGHATANIEAGKLLLPPPGVYAARACQPKKNSPSPPAADDLKPAIVYIGTAPTICPESKQKSLEVHLLESSHELYNTTLEVQILTFIREERRFESAGALKHQIEEDIRIMQQRAGA